MDQAAQQRLVLDGGHGFGGNLVPDRIAFGQMGARIGHVDAPFLAGIITHGVNWQNVKR